jgi:hypothetical protein
MHEPQDSRKRSLWIAFLVPLGVVGAMTVWVVISWEHNCHAGPSSEITGWPYFVLGLTFVVPALLARQQGQSVWVSIGQGVLSVVLTIVLFCVMYFVWASSTVDFGACLG